MLVANSIRRLAVTGLRVLLLAGGWATPWGLALVAAAAPSSNEARTTEMSINQQDFGKDQRGRSATLFTCTNRHGCRLQLTDYGAHVVAVEVPDREGKLANVNLGFSSLAGYLERHPFFGATVGRFCNRIAGGQFELNGKHYTLAKNDGPNHLHGGLEGFNRHFWQAEEVQSEEEVGVRFQARQSGWRGRLPWQSYRCCVLHPHKLQRAQGRFSRQDGRGNGRQLDQP